MLAPLKSRMSNLMFALALLTSVAAPRPACAAPPVITAPATVTGSEGTAVSITGSATDPDAQNVTLSQTNNATFLMGAASAGPSLNPSITLTGTPSLTQSGTYTITWTATDGAGGSATATTTLTIANLNRNPIIVAPPNASVTVGLLISITGSASDPDGQNVTLSQNNNAPFFTASSSSGPSLNPSITLTGTPSLTQSGTYTINWSATDSNSPAGTAIATTSLVVTGCSLRAPTIVAPGFVSGSENTAVSITATATDPDGQNITLSQTNNAPFLTGPASAGPSLNPSITLTGTPSFTQSGTYTIQWSVSPSRGSPCDPDTVRTTLSIANVNRNPVITAPATVSGLENTAVSVTGSATDPDGQNVTLTQTNNAPFFPASSSAGPSLNPSITLTGTPSFTQAGTYTINWSATDVNVPAGTASATTTVSIGCLQRPPVITAPASVSGTENTAVSVTGSATDPDGQNVTLTQTNNAPFFPASSSAGPALNPSIMLTGTPSFTQSGTYTVNWSVTATTGCGGVPATATATTTIMIANTNQNPVITAAATYIGSEGAALFVVGSATDPDAQMVTLSQTNNAPFLAGPASAGPSLNPTIVLTGTPSYTQSGTYTINWAAVDNSQFPGTVTATSSVVIANVNRNPVIAAPATVSYLPGTAVSVTGSASDPDGQSVTLTQTNNAPFFPASSSAGPSLNPSLTLTGSPSSTQSGTYAINWTATDTNLPTPGLSTALTYVISGLIIDNFPPTITAPTSVNGSENTSVSVTASARDPDGGQTVTLNQTNNAAFLAGPASAGPATNPSITLTGTPSFAQSGTYTINWTATDSFSPTGTASATTTLTIANVVTDCTRAFTSTANQTIRLSSGKPFWCVSIEPIGGCYRVAEIDPASVVLSSPGTGSVSQISASVGKGVIVGDADGNNVEDIAFCFRKADLRLLFSNVTGKTTVEVAVSGRLVTGGEFRTTLSVQVIGSGGNQAASVYPNPLNPEGTLSFVSTKAGRARVRLFDHSGRLIRTLTEGTLTAGYHDIRIDGRDAQGRPLASGVYFYRVELEEGILTGRFSLLK